MVKSPAKALLELQKDKIILIRERSRELEKTSALIIFLVEIRSLKLFLSPPNTMLLAKKTQLEYHQMIAPLHS